MNRSLARVAVATAPCADPQGIRPLSPEEFEALTPRMRRYLGGFRAEVSLARSALLFADEIEVLSLTVQQCFDCQYEEIIGLEEPEGLCVISKVLSGLANPPESSGRTMYGRALAGSPVEGTHQAVRALFQRNLHVFEALIELEPAMKAGLLRFGPRSAKGLSPDEASDAFVNQILEVAQSPEALLLVNDELESILVQSEPKKVGRGARVTQATVRLAQDFTLRLPNVSAIPMDELLGVREELTPYRVRFLGKLTEFAATVEAEPWSMDFTREADVIFRQHVGPALADLEDALKTDSAVGRVLKAAATAVEKPAAAIAFGVTTGALSGSVIAGAVTASLTTVGEAYTSYKEMLKEKQQREQNAMFFLYRARDLLTKT